MHVRHVLIITCIYTCKHTCSRSCWKWNSWTSKWSIKEEGREGGGGRRRKWSSRSVHVSDQINTSCLSEVVVCGKEGEYGCLIHTQNVHMCMSCHIMSSSIFLLIMLCPAFTCTVCCYTVWFLSCRLLMCDLYVRVFTCHLSVLLQLHTCVQFSFHLQCMHRYR